MKNNQQNQINVTVSCATSDHEVCHITLIQNDETNESSNWITRAYKEVSARLTIPEFNARQLFTVQKSN